MIQWLGTTSSDFPHARAVLGAWNISPGGPKLLYVPNVLDPLSWSQQDGVLLHAFASWWVGSGYGSLLLGTGSPAQATLTDAHLSALDKWAAGNVVLPPALDVSASKALLVLWGKTDGAGLVPADYGLQPADLAPSWTSRDGQALTAFGKWWYEQGEKPNLTGSALTTEHAAALKKWFIGRVAKAPANFIPPSLQPKTKPAAENPPPALPGAVAPPAPPVAAKDNTALYVLGGVLVAVVGGLWFWMARTPRAALPPGPRENPKVARFKIVVAWLVDEVEVVSSGRRDIGERPTLRDVKVPRAVMWKSGGSEKDIEKAQIYAAKEGYQVFVYPTSERDPLGRARREIAGR